VKLDRFFKWRWGLCFIAGFFLAAGISLWQWQIALRPLVAPLPQDPSIQVFFNHSQASVYQDPYRHIRRYGDNLEQVILDQITEAKVSIDIAVQELNLPLVAQALVRQARAGIKVRLVLEHTYSEPWSDKPQTWIAQQDEHLQGKFKAIQAFGDINQDGTISASEAAERDALKILAQGQIPILDDRADGSKGSGLMHHKFMIIDNQRVVSGSANWTLSDIHGDFDLPETRGNSNALLTIDNPALAKLYSQEFDILWGDGPQGKSDSRFGAPKPRRSAQFVALPRAAITVQFSPHSTNTPFAQTVNGLIASNLLQAKRQVDLALFVFSEQEIADSLEAKSRAGVQVRTLIDPGFVYRDYSEALDMLGIRLPNHQCRYEKNNRPWSQPITSVGFPNLAEGDKLHHKFALIDDITVIVGSHNWSKAANTTNDENTLVITSPTVAKHFRREFDRLYRDARLNQTEKLQWQMAAMQQKCGKTADVGTVK
jgi:phosphatidylserine/phosphatidylglycerophosphate/cardiolipin synthase-like enzyme